MQRDYELTLILSTTLDEDAQAAAVERVNQLIGAAGGAVTEMHAWGRRRLAYPIAHQRDGFYVTTRFNMPTLGLAAFENDLRLNEGILRHLVVRQDEVPLRPLGPVVPAAAHTAPPAVAARAAEPEPVPDEAEDDEAEDAEDEFEEAIPADEE